MIKRTPEQWRELFIAQRSSGLNQAQFCKREGLCPKHFSLRRKQLLSGKTTVPASTPFVKAQPPSTASANQVSLYYHGIEIRLANADPHWIAAVVKQLA